MAHGVCSSVTLVHPAKAVGRNEMPFDRDARVVPSNIILNCARSPREGEIYGRKNSHSQSKTPSQNLHCKLRLRPNSYRYIYIPYSNSATPYPTVPSPTPYDFPFPNLWVGTPASGFSRMHECNRRHPYRRADHATGTFLQ